MCLFEERGTFVKCQNDKESVSEENAKQEGFVSVGLHGKNEENNIKRKYHVHDAPSHLHGSTN
jgi:hypothetical protein